LPLNGQEKSSMPDKSQQDATKMAACINAVAQIKAALIIASGNSGSPIDPAEINVEIDRDARTLYYLVTKTEWPAGWQSGRWIWWV
jgi:hypothetical protein